MDTRPHLSAIVAAGQQLGRGAWDRENPAASDRAWFGTGTLRNSLGWFLDYKDPHGTSRGPNGETVLAARVSPLYGGQQVCRWFAARAEAIAWIEAHETEAMEAVALAALSGQRAYLSPYARLDWHKVSAAIWRAQRRAATRTAPHNPA